MKTFVYGWKMGSKTVRRLTDALGIKAISHKKSKFKAHPDTTVINWGSSDLPNEVVKTGRLLNKPELVAECTNKLKFFRKMEDTDVAIPEFTTDKEVVQEWLDDKKVVFARRTLQGHSGEGIDQLEQGDIIPDAPLYTLYIPKKEEYRVHVMAGKIIDVQRKAKRLDIPKEEIDYRVRNHDGGFIFSRDGGKLRPPATVKEEAVKCFKTTGLDFCSVDIIYNKHRKQAYVLEVNTATGLEGTTLDNYVDGFRKNFNVL